MFGEEKKRLDLICEESSSKRVCVRTRACVLQREREKERFEREREICKVNQQEPMHNYYRTSLSTKMKPLDLVCRLKRSGSDAIQVNSSF